MTPEYAYAARVLRIIDADTLDVDIDVGFRMWARMPLRLYGVDAPERYTPEGQTAAAFVTTLLPVPAPVVVRTVKPADKYGRYLAQVFYGPTADTSLAATLLERGLAVPYTP